MLTPLLMVSFSSSSAVWKSWSCFTWRRRRKPHKLKILFELHLQAKSSFWKKTNLYNGVGKCCEQAGCSVSRAGEKTFVRHFAKSLNLLEHHGMFCWDFWLKLPQAKQVVNTVVWETVYPCASPCMAWFRVILDTVFFRVKWWRSREVTQSL